MFFFLFNAKMALSQNCQCRNGLAEMTLTNEIGLKMTKTV